MLKLNTLPKKKERESTIALINIVFLMLIFFLIAGTITPPIDSSVDPVTGTIDENADLGNLLAVRSDGQLFYQSESIEAASYISKISNNDETASDPIRLFVDQKLEATKLIEIINELKASGASAIKVITKRDVQ